MASTTRSHRSLFAILAILATVPMLLTSSVKADATTTATTTILKTFHSAGTSDNIGTAVDSQGNFYVSGYTGNDLLVTKYNAAGTQLWQRDFPSSWGAGVKDVAVDSAGNVYGAGWFCGATDFGGTVGTVVSNATCDGFAMKLDSTGSALWVRNWGNAALGGDGADGLGIDQNGNAYVAAYLTDVNTEGATGFDGIHWSRTNTNGWIDGYVVFKFNTSGQLQYATPGPGGFWVDGYGHPFAVSAIGKVLIGGETYGTANFGTFGSFTTPDAASDATWFELGRNGVIDQAKSYSGTNDQVIRGLSYDIAGTIYVQGLYTNTTVVSGTSLTSAGVDDAFVAKYDTTGTTMLWLTHWGGTSNDEEGGISVDNAGNIVVAGVHRGSFTVAGIGTFATSPIGNNDAISLGLDPDGTIVWIKPITGAGDDEFAWARPTAATGAAFIAGHIHSTTNFGDGLTYTFGGAADSGRPDGFLQKIAIAWTNTTPLTPQQVPQDDPQSAPAVGLNVPLVGSVSPKLLSSTAGGSITISGSRMSNVTSVLLGTSSLSFKITSDSALTVTMPAHAAGPVDLTIKTTTGVLPIASVVYYSDELGTHRATATFAYKSKAGLLTALARFTKVSFIDCSATYGPKTSAAKTSALAKAKAVCAAASMSAPAASVSSSVTFKKGASLKVGVSVTGRAKD